MGIMEENFTRMGYIDGVSQQELKQILGEGSVQMTFELAN